MAIEYKKFQDFAPTTTLDDTDIVPLQKAGTGAYATLTGALLKSQVTDDLVAFQADSTATDVAGLVSDFNDLLAKLIAAGIMSSS